MLPKLNVKSDKFNGWQNKQWLQWINHFGAVTHNDNADTVVVCICSCI